MIGGGGREHAIALGLARSGFVEQLYLTHANPGMQKLGRYVGLKVEDYSAVASFCKAEGVGVVVVGPEAPLVGGIADVLRAEGIGVVGPNKAAAQLEGSKAFAKAFMQRYQIPTAAYQTFSASQLHEAIAYLEKHAYPVVIKASGLAAGKGVFIVPQKEEAQALTHQLLTGELLPDAAKEIVIEEYLDGIEMSVFVVSDGKDWLLLPEAKDYKRIGEKDTGPNTGGMGSVSPVPFFTPELREKVIQKIIVPTFEGLQKEGIRYEGFLFIGLMICKQEPYVLEYNVRMGDPETQSVFSRIRSDIGELCLRVVQQQLAGYTLEVTPQHAVTVVTVSQGYPEAYEKGKAIRMPRQLPEHTMLFHAGTSMQDGQLVTNGGRVLNITCLADTLQEAIHQAYQVADQVIYSNKYLRRDIGQDLLFLQPYFEKE